MPKASAYVYIDGFNLYRRCLEKTQYKWLNLLSLSQMILADYSITKIRYFTADLKSSPLNVGQELRQQVYLRALMTLPEIEIHKGQFRQDIREMLAHPLTYNANGQPIMHKVKKYEEKGSDVNLASNLLLDAFYSKANLYVVLSNDTDLIEPLRIVKTELGKKIGIIFPTTRHAKAFSKIDFDIIRTIREGVLATSQFPEIINIGKTKLQKPFSW